MKFNRREFLKTSATTAALAALAPAARAEDTAAPLVKVLTSVGKTPELAAFPDGSKVLLLPYGGRVLGLFAPGDPQNFYWINTALESEQTARAFYESKEWHNSGGDRTWLSPEVDIFLPNFPSTEGYFQPRELDPGNYQLVRNDGGVQLVNELKLRLSRSGKTVSVRITKSVAAAANPLRYEDGLTTDGVRYAGYTQHTTLEILGENPLDQPAVGLWNLVQMPHGGEMLIPTFSRTAPKIWFGEIPAGDLAVTDHLVRYRMRAQGEQKLGIRAIATTGRIGYMYGDGDKTTLIVRNFVVNPSGEYIDVPWKEPGDLGYSTQACNVNSKLGSFSELEYHIPAIGKSTGRARCDDAAQVWAFRGPLVAIQSIARRILSPEV